MRRRGARPPRAAATRRGSSTTDVELRTHLGELGGAWDELAVARPRPSPFLLHSWLRHAGGPHARYLLAHEGARLVGGLALEEDRRLGVPRLRPAGEVLGADHLDLVAAPADAPRVVAALREWITTSGPWLVDLRGMRADSWVGAALPGRVHRLPDACAPWSPLPTSFDEYLDARPPVLRSSLRRARRRLEREGATYRVLPPAEAAESVGELRRLHALLFPEDSSPILREFDRFAAAARAVLASGIAAIHELSAEGRAIAMEMVFELRGVTSFFQGGRELDARWKSPGTVLIAHAVERAIARGDREIDFLRGLEPYKRHWAECERGMVRLLAGVGGGPRVLAAVLPAAGRARRALQRLRGTGGAEALGRP